MVALSIRRMVMSSLFGCSSLFVVNTADAANEETQRSSDYSSPQLLYEARNWMPRASDDNPVRRVSAAKRRSNGKKVSVKNRKRKKYGKSRRLNLAQYKASLAARIGIRRLIRPNRPANSTARFDLRHVGRHLGLGGGNLEGAGYSPRSASEALAVCSFSQYGFPVLYQGVAKGRDGYFAYKIYRW